MAFNNEQTPGTRVVIESLDREFARLHERACRLIKVTPCEKLYNLTAETRAINPRGESLIRSAGLIEQTFGGLTANLWDDPFEWTLPETLSTRELVLEYFAEVEATRKRAFAGFASDADLARNISLPSETFEPLIVVLLNALVRAAEYQAQAGVVNSDW